MSHRKKGNDANDQALVKVVEDLDTKSQQILKVILPQKVVSLTSTLEKDSDFSLKPSEVRCKHDFSKTENQPNKKRKIEVESTIQTTSTAGTDNKIDHPVSSNQILMRIFGKIKLEIIEFIDYISTLKMWVHMHVPKIEDGNNFGVQVQEEVLSELTRCEDFTVQTLAISTKYYLFRAKVISKCIKYPDINDFMECVDQLDEKTYTELITSMRDLRNNYAIVYDFVQKNKDKVLCPRSSYTGTMF